MSSHLINKAKASVKSQQWAKNNPDRTKRNKLNFLLRHPERRILKAAKQNARVKGIDFNLEESDIIIPDICPALKTQFEYRSPYTASIDRIDPTKGYIKGNIQIISKKANLMKNNATREELIRFANWVLS